MEYGAVHKTIKVEDALRAAKQVIMLGQSGAKEHVYQQLAYAILGLPEYIGGPTPAPEGLKSVAEPLGAQADQAAVFREALDLYRERSGERAEIWRRAGLKGLVFQMLCKAERAFAQAMRDEMPNRDHFIDLANYAAFAVRLIDEVGDNEGAVMALDGVWPWRG